MDFLNAYPHAGAGQKRYVIELKPQPNEEDFKVELIPGRMESVDGVNHHTIAGRIAVRTLQGYGYEFYDVKLGATASTRMMPLGDDASLREKFVHSKPKMIRYNSKAPVVVFMPEEGELHYRIWSVTKAGDTEDLVAPEK